MASDESGARCGQKTAVRSGRTRGKMSLLTRLLEQECLWSLSVGVHNPSNGNTMLCSLLYLLSGSF